MIGPWGSGAPLEVNFVTIPISHHGFMSRGAETDLIRRLKLLFPGLALNQKEVGPDTSIQANNEGWFNGHRVVTVSLVRLKSALNSGMARLAPDRVGHIRDAARLEAEHDSEHFI